MKFSIALLLATFASDALASAVAIRAPDAVEHQPLERADGQSDYYQDLWKRKGGGGGGGRGGGGGGGSSSGGGSSGGGSSGGGSSGGGSSGGRGGGGSSGSGGTSGGGRGGASRSGGRGGGSSSPSRGSSGSSVGGQTRTGSGPPPQYGGGAYYGGGARVPYRSGSRSPSGIAPIFLGAGLALAFWPGIWYHGAYMYPYSHPYGFYNATSDTNETKPVTCGCDPTSECACDENTNSTYMSDLIGNGSYAALNKSVIDVADVNGTSTILINGTLPNGTTASGGTEDANAAAGLRFLLQSAGWWPVVATVCAMVFIS